jgi:hypothetical protein
LSPDSFAGLNIELLRITKCASLFDEYRICVSDSIPSNEAVTSYTSVAPEV